MTYATGEPSARGVGAAADGGAVLALAGQLDAGSSDPATRPRSVLDRVTVLLDCFDHDSDLLTLSQLCARAGLPKSTVYRFAEQLLAIGWLERTGELYGIGLGLSVIGNLAHRHARLRWVAAPRLQRLASLSGCTVQLAVLDEGEVECLEVVTSPGLPSPVGEGQRLPALSSSAGRALLSRSTPAELGAAQAVPRTRRTPHTILDAAVLLRELAEVRASGLCVEREEIARGLSSVSAPVVLRGRAVAAVTASTRSVPFDVPRIGALVHHCADSIAEVLRLPRAPGLPVTTSRPAAVVDRRHIA